MYCLRVHLHVHTIRFVYCVQYNGRESESGAHRVEVLILFVDLKEASRYRYVDTSCSKYR